MALSDLDVKAVYQGNGSTDTFAIPFTKKEDSQVVVIVRDESDAANPTETVSAAYTISGSNVVMTTAPAATDKLIVMRESALTQTQEYQNAGHFDIESFEDRLDRVTMMIQELDEAIKRCVRVAPGLNSIPEIVKFTANGTLTVSADGSEVEVS